MIITLTNLTATPKSYVSGTISLSASSTVSVPESSHFELAQDPSLFSDITKGFVSITDGVNVFVGDDAIRYLASVWDRFNPLVDANGENITLGQKTSANSLPVVLSTDQTSIPSSLSGIVSTGNSTTTPLGSNGIFTGTGQDVLNYGTIVVACTASHAGTLKLQWSRDNTNWIDDGDTYTINAGSLKKTSYGPVMQYFRVVFTNNSAAQSSFTLSTILKTGHTKPSTHKLSESVTDDSDSELVYAVGKGRKSSDNTYGSVQLNASNDLVVNYRNSYSRVTGNTTSTVKSGAGTLHGIIVGANWTGGTITVYDNTAGSGTVIMQLDTGSPSGGLLSTSGIPGPSFLGPLGISFNTGLTVVTAGSGSNDVTLIYQ